MWKYAALISYLGTKYCGWQRQKKADGVAQKPNIQGKIEETLARIVGEQASVVGSGRTDSGVHAIGQVAHFVLKNKEWNTSILQNALNALLPDDIRVLAVRAVELDFHAQRSAELKQYSYYFQQGPCALPRLIPHSVWIRRKLDLEAMKTGLACIVGEHDFKPFQSSGAKPGPTVRRIFEAEVSWKEIDLVPPDLGFGLVRVRIIGSGFLKQMVRGIAGTLLQVGDGRRPPEAFQDILHSGDRSQVGPTAPGRGLWLEFVRYPGFKW